MSLFLILLAAGESKRLKSATPKPFVKVNGKSLLELSYESFASIKKIKKTVIVYNKKHKKYLSKLYLGNALRITGGRTRQESTLIALKKIKKMNCKKVLIHDAARPNASKKLINEIINKLNYNHAVVPLIKTEATRNNLKEEPIILDNKKKKEPVL